MSYQELPHEKGLELRIKVDGPLVLGILKVVLLDVVPSSYVRCNNSRISSQLLDNLCTGGHVLLHECSHVLAQLLGLLETATASLTCQQVSHTKKTFGSSPDSFLEDFSPLAALGMLMFSRANFWRENSTYLWLLDVSFGGKLKSHFFKQTN
jgi:hypothetical protein